MSKTAAKMKIENVLQPGKTYSADPAKYEAMKKAVLAVLPKASPGLTVAEVQDRVVAHLPEDLFPGGAKSGWWMKAVQLDLEAKGVIRSRKDFPDQAAQELRRQPYRSSLGKELLADDPSAVLNCRRKSPRLRLHEPLGGKDGSDDQRQRAGFRGEHD